MLATAVASNCWQRSWSPVEKPYSIFGMRHDSAAYFALSTKCNDIYCSHTNNLQANKQNEKSEVYPDAQ